MSAEEIAPEDDRVDPANLPEGYTPAYVDVRGQGPVYVADYRTLSSGWISVTEWPGSRAKLPPHRVLALREVRTERHGEDRNLRVADDDKREQARADYPGRVDGAKVRKDEVDCGEGVRTDGGESEEDTPVVDEEMFERGLTALRAAEEIASQLAAEYEDLQTGLSDSDTIALLYGRRNSLNKTDIKGAVAALEDINRKSNRTLVKRLLADLSDLNQSEAAAFLEEIEDLRQKYGGME